MPAGNGKHHFRRLQQRLRPGKKGITVERPVLDFDFVYFTHHALIRMKERGVRRSEVFAVLDSPDKKGLKTEPGRERWRKKRSKSLGVDVVFERWPTKICIVTVMVISI
jgi:hypothetical protein